MKSSFQNIVELKKVFARFKKIPQQSYYDFIYFYQQYFNQICLLPFNEYINIRQSYIESLYHLEKFDLFHSQLKSFLQELLNHEEFNEYHRKVYIELLFLKSQAYANSYNTKESIAVLKEIYRMDYDHKLISKRLFQLIFKSIQHQDKKYYGLSIIGLIATLGLTVCNTLFVAPFYPNMASNLEYLRNSLFLGSMLFSLLILFKAFLQAQRMLADLRSKS